MESKIKRLQTQQRKAKLRLGSDGYLFVHERASVSAGAGVMMEERGRDGGSSDGIGAVVREGTLEDCGKEVVKHAGMCWSGVLEVARSHAWTSWEHEGPL